MAVQKNSRSQFLQERVWTRTQLEKLAEEPLIDSRTGQFRGDPVGVVECCLHPHLCPANVHCHVLWYRNAVPRMTTMGFALEHFPGYVKRAMAFRTRQHLLRDLYA